MLFVRNAIKEKVREYEVLCKKYPAFAENKILDGRPSIGGLLADLEVWRYALENDMVSESGIAAVKPR